MNLTVENSPYKVDYDNSTVANVPKSNPLPPAPVERSNDIWYYVSVTKE
jgi:hypothetical protein